MWRKISLEERRTGRRQGCSLEAVVTQGPTRLHATLVELSPGGLRLKVDRPLAPGTLLKITAVDQGAVPGLARVVWCRGGLAGLSCRQAIPGSWLWRRLGPEREGRRHRRFAGAGCRLGGCVVSDLSLGGASLWAWHAAEVGEVVQLTLEREGRSLAVVCCVVGCQAELEGFFRVRVRFLKDQPAVRGVVRKIAA